MEILQITGSNVRILIDKILIRDSPPKKKEKTPNLEEMAPESHPETTTDTGPNSGVGASVPEPTGAAAIHTDSGNDRPPGASLNDIWAQYYAQNDPAIPALVNVCEVIHYNQPLVGKAPSYMEHGNLLRPPLIRF